MMKRNILIVLFALLFAVPVFSENYVFDHISTADGLPNNRIRSIIQDASGYLWIATSKGLVRYDGHSFHNFPENYEDSLQLGTFRLRRIFEDKNGVIWSTSLSGRCYRIDPKTQRVTGLQELNLISGDRKVKDYFLASNGDVWLILDKGAVRIYYSSVKDQLFSQLFNADNIGTDGVNFIFEDSEHKIWLGTNFSLISVSVDETESEKFELKNFFMNKGIAFKSVEEYGQKLYFGASNRREFIIYDKKSEVFASKFQLNEKLDGFVTHIASNSQGFLLMGISTGQLVYYNTSDDDYHIVRMKSLKESKISGIFTDSYGCFWVITQKRGIFRFKPESLSVEYYSLDAENRIFLGELDKQQLFEDSNRDLWIGINGGGLFKYDRDEDVFQQYKHKNDNLGSLSSDVVTSIYEDNSQNLWIGTSNGGLNRISLKPQNNLIRLLPVQKTSTSFDNYTRTVISDVMDNTWVGTKAGKIYIFDKNEKKIGTLPDDLSSVKQFPSANIYALYFDNDYNLWIGTKGYGLFVIKDVLKYINNLSDRNIEIVHFEHNEKEKNSLSSDNIYSITQDVFGQYWIGAFKSGLDMLINPFSNPVIIPYSVKDEEYSSMTSSEIRDLMIDRNNNLWIATSNGVSLLKSEYLLSNDKKFIPIHSDKNIRSSVPEEVVYKIKQLSNGDIVLALLDGGFQRINYSAYLNGDYTPMSCSAELAYTSVYSIEEDNNGDIWMGSDKGLLRYNSDYELIDQFSIEDNQMLVSFSENCSCSKLSQELVFGTTNGLVILHPDSMRRDSTQYPLVFSKLEINGTEITVQNSDILTQPITSQEEILLDYDQNNVSLSFSVLDFNNSKVIQYKSFLEGYDSYWGTPSENNTVSYRKLPPGKYVLHVKGTNSSGIWLDEMASIRIVIKPMFIHSVVGNILVLLLIVVIISVILLLIYRQVRIKNKIKVEHAITEKRIEYYTNLSHEFKTPLSLILGPVDDIISNSEGTDLSHQKALQIKKNATYLNHLIDQILDFRKMREGHMPLFVYELDVVVLLRDIYYIFLPLAKKMAIDFHFDSNMDNCLGYIDPKHLEKIAYNLLSNAFRFTKEHNSVVLKVIVEGGMLTFIVQDEGPGIEESELKRIFERFYDSKHSTGIGLFYTKELVMSHKGSISVANNEQKGASFKVSIPLKKEAYSETEIAEKHNYKLDLKSIKDITTIINKEDESDMRSKHDADYFETILVVEDNAEMRAYLKKCLSDKYNVIEAEDGAIALEKAEEYQPSLVLCDLIMPNIDGYEVLKRLKNSFNTSHIPVIIVTAESSDDHIILAMESGADDIISKPFNVNFLLAKVEHAIVQRKRLKERFERDQSKEGKTDIAEDDKSIFLKQVQDLVLSNMSNENMNVELLVEKMGYSRTLFYKKMRSFSGYAPNEYIRIVRMKEGARLLTTTNLTINEISTCVGISDPNYFSKTFKKHFGESPSSYKAHN